MRFSSLAAALLAVLAVLAAAAPCTAQAPTATPAAAQPLTQSDVETWLDGLVPYAIASGDIAGGVVVVVKDGQILAEKGYGYADVARRIRVDPRATLFRPGSISKTFTWTAVMQLVEQGKLDLDVDVNRYLDFKIPPRDGKPITLRNLMTHTPGFEEKLKDLVGRRPDVSLERYVKSWTPCRIYAPGTVPAYSNYGATLAGYIVQRVSGEPYAAYMERHVLAPIGMTSSTFDQPPHPPLRARLSQGYKLASQPPTYFEVIPPSPAGGLSATGEDMGRFMLAHLQNGAEQGGRLLKPETAVAMHATQPKIYPALNGMALGFYEQSRNGHRVIAHNGGTQFFHSDMHLFVDDGVGVFISLNSAGRPGAISGLHDALYHGFADRYFPSTSALPAPAVDAKTALAHARMMAGEWESSRRSASNFMSLAGLLGPMLVTANDDGTINLPIPERGVKRWREVFPFVWREVGGVERIQAVTSGGRPLMFGFDSAPPAAFMPVPGWRASSWLLPALLGSLGCLLLTGLAWPVAALVRRAYGRRLELSRWRTISRRGAKISALATVGVMAAWIVTLLVMASDLAYFAPESDGWILVLQGLGSIALPASLAFAVWDALLLWSGTAGWAARLWTAIMIVSCAIVFWTGAVFHLVGLSTAY